MNSLDTFVIVSIPRPNSLRTGVMLKYHDAYKIHGLLSTLCVGVYVTGTSLLCAKRTLSTFLNPTPCQLLFP